MKFLWDMRFIDYFERNFKNSNVLRMNRLIHISEDSVEFRHSSPGRTSVSLGGGYNRVPGAGKIHFFTIEKT